MQTGNKEGTMRPLFLVLSYVIEFTVCGFCGWLYEEALEFAVFREFSDRGVLHLPVLPIYGFGGLLLVWLFRKRNHPAFVFAVSTVVTTVLELAASYPLEKALGYLPWWYGEWPLNFEGRISLLSSLLFGVLALLLVNLVHPACRKFAAWAKPAVVGILGTLLLAVIAVDAVTVFILPKIG